MSELEAQAMEEWIINAAMDLPDKGGLMEARVLQRDGDAAWYVQAFVFKYNFPARISVGDDADFQGLMEILRT